MVGGGSRRDDGPLKINSTNVFAALDTLKKKKSDKHSKSKRSSKGQAKEPEPQVFWAPTPLTSKSWADVDDDDDYFSTTAPPQPVWSLSEKQQKKEAVAMVEEESESEVDGIDVGDDDAEEEPEHEPELDGASESVIKKDTPVSVPAKDAEKQLSKKELKKKEMAELDALLHELGISGKESNDSQDGTNDIKQLEQSGNQETKENIAAPFESKSSKKKKSKKEKSLKETKEEEQLSDLINNKGPDELAADREVGNASAVDVKEKMKKMASMKKKKMGKEMDAAAKAAAVEAAARSARLAAAKKKEKNHYNQQPVR